MPEESTLLRSGGTRYEAAKNRQGSMPERRLPRSDKKERGNRAREGKRCERGPAKGVTKAGEESWERYARGKARSSLRGTRRYGKGNWNRCEAEPDALGGLTLRQKKTCRDQDAKPGTILGTLPGEGQEGRSLSFYLGLKLLAMKSRLGYLVWSDVNMT